MMACRLDNGDSTPLDSVEAPAADPQNLSTPFQSPECAYFMDPVSSCADAEETLLLFVFLAMLYYN